MADDDAVVLDGTTVEAADLAALPPTVRRLSLAHCALTAATLAHLPRLLHLRRLCVADNPRLDGGAALCAIAAKCPYLESLDASNTNIATVDALEPLDDLTNLRSLSLISCPVALSGDPTAYRAAIFSALPTLEALDGYDANGDPCESSGSEEDDELEEDDDLDETGSQEDELDEDPHYRRPAGKGIGKRTASKYAARAMAQKYVPLKGPGKSPLTRTVHIGDAGSAGSGSAEDESDHDALAEPQPDEGSWSQGASSESLGDEDSQSDDDDDDDDDDDPGTPVHVPLPALAAAASPRTDDESDPSEIDLGDQDSLTPSGGSDPDNDPASDVDSVDQIDDDDEEDEDEDMTPSDEGSSLLPPPPALQPLNPWKRAMSTDGAQLLTGGSPEPPSKRPHNAGSSPAGL